MLEELSNVTQVAGEPRRRWFRDQNMDLIVWFNPDDSITGFQLCYATSHGERALTWFKDKGFTHSRVDDGEGVGARHKMTPILLPDGAVDQKRLLHLLERDGAHVEYGIINLVAETIRKYPLP